MKWQELIESAQLDALGLLDEQEREAFDLAFARLPTDLKAQLRAEQDRAIRATLADTGTNELPPVHLRGNVLNAVKVASGGEVVQENRASRGMPPMRRARAVSPMWRAAALGLVAACVVMGGVVVQLMSSVERLGNESQAAQLARVFDDQFPRNSRDIAFDANTVHRIFAASKSFSGKAAVFANPRWESAQFQCLDFPVANGQRFRVVVLDESGAIAREVANFKFEGGRQFADLKVGAAELSRLAVVLVESNGTEAIVMTMRA